MPKTFAQSLGRCLSSGPEKVHKRIPRQNFACKHLFILNSPGGERANATGFLSYAPF